MYDRYPVSVLSSYKDKLKLYVDKVKLYVDKLELSEDKVKLSEDKTNYMRQTSGDFSQYEAFCPGISNLHSNWVRLAPNGTNLRLEDQCQYVLARPGHFGPKWDKSGTF